MGWLFLKRSGKLLAVRFLTFEIIFILSFHVVCMHHGVYIGGHVEVRGQVGGVGSLCPLCRSWGWSCNGQLGKLCPYLWTHLPVLFSHFPAAFPFLFLLLPAWGCVHGSPSPIARMEYMHDLPSSIGCMGYAHRSPSPIVCMWYTRDLHISHCLHGVRAWPSFSHCLHGVCTWVSLSHCLHGVHAWASLSYCMHEGVHLGLTLSLYIRLAFISSVFQVAYSLLIYVWRFYSFSQ